MLSLEKTAVRLFGPGGRLPGSSTKAQQKWKENREKTRASAFFRGVDPHRQMRLTETVQSQGRIPQFHAAVDERFAFLLDQGFRIAERTSDADRFGQVRFEMGRTQVYLSWDAFAGGELEAKMDGTNLWPLVVEEGLWDAGRCQSVYMGFAIEAMQHGLDRIAALLKVHPEMLSAK